MDQRRPTVPSVNARVRGLCGEPGAAGLRRGRLGLVGLRAGAQGGATARPTLVRPASAEASTSKSSTTAKRPLISARLPKQSPARLVRSAMSTLNELMAAHGTLLVLDA